MIYAKRKHPIPQVETSNTPGHMTQCLFPNARNLVRARFFYSLEWCINIRMHMVLLCHFY